MPTLGKQTYQPVNGYAEATSNISVTSRAKTINDAIAACEKSKVIGAGFHQARVAARESATKNGNFIYDRSSLVSLGMTARTPDGTSSVFLRNHFDVAKLDTARIAGEAIRKALDSRNPRVLEPGVYPAILEPQAVADLVGQLAFSFDARSAEEGRSPFSAPGGKTKVGSKDLRRAAECLQRSVASGVAGSKSAQGGLPAQKIYLVRNGVLRTLFIRASGRNRKARNRRLVQSTASSTVLNRRFRLKT